MYGLYNPRQQKLHPRFTAKASASQPFLWQPKS